MGKPQAGRREHLERNPSIKSQQRIKVLCPSLCNLDQQDSLNMSEKQLELSKRSAFFSDPFFADLKDSMGAGLERRLAEFSARSLGVSGAGLGGAAHNIQVSASNDKFMIQLELPGFSPEDFSLKTKDDIIIIEASHNTKTDDGSTDTRKFTKEFKMPSGVATDQLGSTYSGAGILTISAPRAIEAPEPGLCHGRWCGREEGRQSEQSEHRSHHPVRGRLHHLQLQVILLLFLLLHYDVLRIRRTNANDGRHGRYADAKSDGRTGNSDAENGRHG